jgi:hypothetical protein
MHARRLQVLLNPLNLGLRLLQSRTLFEEVVVRQIASGAYQEKYK